MTDNGEDLHRRLQEAESIVAALKGEEVDAVVTRTSVALLRLRQTEEKLRRSEEHLRMALQIGKIGTRYLDLHSGKMDLSERARQIYGLPLEEEVTVARLLEIIHPEDRPGKEKMFARAARAAARFENEYRVIHPDGSEHWVSSCCESFADEQGQAAFIIGMVMDITEKKLYQEQLIAFNQTLEKHVKQSTAQVETQTRHLRALASKMTRVEHEERKRVARILHDHVQQLLVGARMQLGMLKRCKQAVQMHQIVDTIDNTLDQAIQSSRSLAVDLSPPALQERGLCGGLQWLASHMQKTNSFTLHLELDGRAEPSDHNIKILLFECARELVLNAVKHARVSRADLTLKKHGDSCIALGVADAGTGFNPDILQERIAENATFGLFSIQERLTHIGGRVNITSRPGGGGTCITLEAPLQGR